MSSTDMLTHKKVLEESKFHKDDYKRLTEEVKTMYDSLAEIYDYFYPPIDFETSAFMQTLHNFLQEHRVKKLLDCACGTGRELIPLAQTRSYKPIVGSDLSSGMLEKARLKACTLPVEFVQSDWVELPNNLKCADFDAVLCMGNSFAHIPPWFYKEVFSSIYCLLRPGGLLIFNRRNWEAELGEIEFKRARPKITVYNPFPIISVLNVRDENSKEVVTYFSYHNYDTSFRTQLLHFLEVNTDGSHEEKVFKFQCFYVRMQELRKVLSSAGFRHVAELSALNEVENFDAYAEEEFFCVLK